MEFLFEYGLFLAKTITFVFAIGFLVAIIVSAASKNKSNKGELVIEDISEKLTESVEGIKKSFLNKDEIKAFDKKRKKEQKENQDRDKKKLFIIEFDGGIQAKEVDSLREEISAIVSVAQEGDEVLLKLESPGGVVHGYGLAASQLARLKNKGIKLTASVDKVAASGGYMMACVADKIVAAPFAIVGSIGVIAQLPNINKLLKKNDIEIEQHTAGQFKRTLTVLGENTDTAREKFREELQETHELFKSFVTENRSVVDIDKVATGEHWYGTQALDLNLVDEIKTSDDIILSSLETFHLYKVTYKGKMKLAEKLGVSASHSLSTFAEKLTSNWMKVNRF